MVTTNNDIITYKKTPGVRQKFWNYIRRNRNFRVQDVLMICGGSTSFLQKYLRYLEKAGYVKYTTKSMPFTGRNYVLLKNTGAVAPSLLANSLYDNNIHKEIVVLKGEKTRKIYAPKGLVKMLEVLCSVETIDQESLVQASGFGIKVIFTYWKRLQKMGIVLGPVLNENKKPICAQNGRKLFLINSSRARAVIKELENGAYTKKTSDLKQLWVN